MSDADYFYFAAAGQVEMGSWSRGDTVVLVGDAGYCATPTPGMGTSQAIIGAHTIATTLAESDGDHRLAFRRYETELRDYIRVNHTGGQAAAAMFGGRP